MKVQLRPDAERGAYPYIGVSSNEHRTLAVLFDSEKCGTVISCTDDEYEIGEYLEIWDETKFQKHQGRFVFFCH